LDQCADPGRRREARDPARALALDAAEIAAAGLGEDADEVDHEVGADHGALHRGILLDVGEQRHDLADGAHRLEEQRGFGVAHRDPYDMAGSGEPFDHVTADEARAAEHRRHAARRHAEPLRCNVNRLIEG
jgi:hypothetical protein